MNVPDFTCNCTVVAQDLCTSQDIGQHIERHLCKFENGVHLHSGLTVFDVYICPQRPAELLSTIVKHATTIVAMPYSLPGRISFCFDFAAVTVAVQPDVADLMQLLL